MCRNQKIKFNRILEIRNLSINDINLISNKDKLIKWYIKKYFIYEYDDT